MCSWLYWSELDDSQSRVMRSNLNGSSVSMLTSQIQTPNGLHLNSVEQVLLVLDGVNGSLFSCPLNSSYNGTVYCAYYDKKTHVDELRSSQPHAAAIYISNHQFYKLLFTIHQ